MLQNADLIAIAIEYTNHRLQPAYDPFTSKPPDPMPIQRAVVAACNAFLQRKRWPGPLSRKDEIDRIEKDVKAFDRVLEVLAPGGEPMSGFCARMMTLDRLDATDARRAIAAIRAFRDAYAGNAEDMHVGNHATGFPRLLGLAFKQEHLDCPTADDTIFVYERLIAAMERDDARSTEELTKHLDRDAKKITDAVRKGYASV